MYKQKFVIISLLFVSSVLFLTSAARAQESEIDRIIKEVSVDTQKGAISNYTYLMKFSYERHKKFAGRKFTRLYEAVLPSKFSTNRIYRHQFVLLQDSERTIPEVDIISARKELAKELEKAENEADKEAVQDKPINDGGYWAIAFSTDGRKVKVDVLQLLKNTQLSNLQRKQIDGKSIVSIDFAPKAEAVLEKNLAYLAKIEGQILIDETDKRIIRIEGFAPGEFAKQKDKTDAERQKETVYLFLQTKVFEGFWFPQTVWVNFAKHPEIFETIEVQFNFTNYKRASVDVKDALDVPKEPTQTITEDKQN